MNVAELLRKTRQLFAATHWGQGGYYANDEKARFCAVGGIRYWVVGDPLLAIDVTLDPEIARALDRRINDLDDGPIRREDEPEYWAAVEILAEAIGVDLDKVRAQSTFEGIFYESEYLDLVQAKIFDWNDADERELPEVLAAFDRAVEIAAKENANVPSG